MSKEILNKIVNRRTFIAGLGTGTLGLIAAACQPQPTEKVVEKEVTRVVEKPVTVTPAPVKSEQQVAAGQVVTDARRVETRNVLPAFPKTAQEAASLFGGAVSRWEKSAEGGWHLREEGFRINVDPKGYLMEAYYDTKPGKDPQCFASAGVALEAQGVTVWPVVGTEEAAKDWQKMMAIPVWSDKQQHPCQVVLPGSRQ